MSSVDALWGLVPIQCTLAVCDAVDKSTLHKRAFTVPRQSYFFLHMETIREEFSNLVEREQCIWLSADIQQQQTAHVNMLHAMNMSNNGSMFSSSSADLTEQQSLDLQQLQQMHQASHASFGDGGHGGGTAGGPGGMSSPAAANNGSNSAERLQALLPQHSASARPLPWQYPVSAILDMLAMETYSSLENVLPLKLTVHFTYPSLDAQSASTPIPIPLGQAAAGGVGGVTAASTTAAGGLAAALAASSPNTVVPIGGPPGDRKHFVSSLLKIRDDRLAKLHVYQRIKQSCCVRHGSTEPLSRMQVSSQQQQQQNNTSSNSNKNTSSSNNSYDAEASSDYDAMFTALKTNEPLDFHASRKSLELSALICHVERQQGIQQKQRAQQAAQEAAAAAAASTATTTTSSASPASSEDNKGTGATSSLAASSSSPNASPPSALLPATSTLTNTIAAATAAQQQEAKLPIVVHVSSLVFPTSSSSSTVSSTNNNNFVYIVTRSSTQALSGLSRGTTLGMCLKELFPVQMEQVPPEALVGGGVGSGGGGLNTTNSNSHNSSGRRDSDNSAKIVRRIMLQRSNKDNSKNKSSGNNSSSSNSLGNNNKRQQQHTQQFLVQRQKLHPTVGKVIVQGIEPLLTTPIEYLYDKYSACDGFLHIACSFPPPPQQ